MNFCLNNWMLLLRLISTDFWKKRQNSGGEGTEKCKWQMLQMIRLPSNLLIIDSAGHHLLWLQLCGSWGVDCLFWIYLFFICVHCSLWLLWKTKLWGEIGHCALETEGSDVRCFFRNISRYCDLFSLDELRCCLRLSPRKGGIGEVFLKFNEWIFPPLVKLIPAFITTSLNYYSVFYAVLPLMATFNNWLG